MIKTTKLEEIAQIYNGIRITRYQDKTKHNNPQKILKSKTGTDYDTENITLKQEINQKYYSQKNDIIIPVIGNNIQIIREKQIIIPANYIIIRVKPQHNPYYIYTILKSRQFDKNIQKLSEGSKLQFIKIPDLKKMKIKIPPKKEQDQYGQILQLINKKNQLLKRKIKINKEIQNNIITQQLGEEYVRL